MNEGRSLPHHVTLPLLDLVREQALDDGYAHVAEAHAAEANTPGGGAPEESRADVAHALVLALALLVGLVGVTAFVQNTRLAPSREVGRQTLIQEITTRGEQVQQMQARSARLQSANARLDGDLADLGERADAALSELRRLQVRTGFLAVAGPGVRWVVDDPVDPEPGARVQDQDLAVLADGLWRAGAEAIAINGQRLTVLSSIRISGGAIYVNGWPLSPPYTIAAIGGDTMPARFLETSNGQLWFDLVDTFGFRFEMHNEDRLVLPAAEGVQLRYARVADGQPEGGVD